MRTFALALFVQTLLARGIPHCAAGERFWTAENVLLGGQTLDDILQRAPFGGNDDFSLHEVTYNGSLATFKYITTKFDEHFARARNEVEMLTRVTRVPRASHILACVTGTDYVGIFLTAQGVDLRTHLFSMAQPPQMITRLELLHKAAQAVADLHAVGIAHGDLRLENFRFKPTPSKSLFLANFEHATGLVELRSEAQGREVTVVPRSPQESRAKDARDFAVMALILLNPEFAEKFYAPPQEGQAPTTPRLEELLDAAKKSSDPTTRKAVVGCIGGSTLSFAQIVAEIEGLVKGLIL